MNRRSLLRRTAGAALSLAGLRALPAAEALRLPPAAVTRLPIGPDTLSASGGFCVPLSYAYELPVVQTARPLRQLPG